MSLQTSTLGKLFLRQIDHQHQPAGSMSGASVELSFFLPLYNEQDNVLPIGRRAIRALEESGYGWELILVDDGSRDATADRSLTLCQGDRVRLIVHQRNRGYGGALKTGFASARGRLVGFCDGDGQFDPADLPKLLCLIKGRQAVFGYRRRRAEGLLRGLPSRAWASLAGALLGFSTRDLDCGFKLFETAFVRKLKLESEGGFISAEILAKAAKLGARVEQACLEHHRRRAGKSTGLRPLVVIRAFAELARFYWRLRTWTP